jgi:hypothetical protein
MPHCISQCGVRRAARSLRRVGPAGPRTRERASAPATQVLAGARSVRDGQPEQQHKKACHVARHERDAPGAAPARTARQSTLPGGTAALWTRPARAARFASRRRSAAARTTLREGEAAFASCGAPSSSPPRLAAAARLARAPLLAARRNPACAPPCIAHTRARARPRPGRHDPDRVRVLLAPACTGSHRATRCLAARTCEVGH